jgi:hypothetical protein
MCGTQSGAGSRRVVIGVGRPFGDQGRPCRLENAPSWKQPQYGYVRNSGGSCAMRAALDAASAVSAGTIAGCFGFGGGINGRHRNRCADLFSGGLRLSFVHVPRMCGSGLAPDQKGQNQKDWNQPESFQGHVGDIAAKRDAVEGWACRYRPDSSVHS